jgi:hypothetical protein
VVVAMQKSEGLFFEKQENCIQELEIFGEIG